MKFLAMLMPMLLLLFAEPEVAIIRIDPDGQGRVYEGIGGVSAGASSELLIDYPEPYKSDILDYLFKPGYGASLQQLKVEIGAGAVVVGSEPSHARSSEELYNPRPEYYQRGYEFWLMREAIDRNPNILTCALEWAAPAYLEGHWTQANADYIVQFIKGAKEYWGIEMNYISPGKNESKISTHWLKDVFKPSLDAAGLSKVNILAPDNLGYYWEICEEMKTDPVLESVIDAVGYHYVYNHLPELGHEEYASSESAKSVDASLWASEDWSAHDGSWKNAHLLAGILNKMYIRDRITAMQIWCPFDGYYDNTGEWKSTGLMRADQPWSGNYEVSPAIWAAAHFTQFTEVGWRYIDSACDYFDSSSGGNYTTFLSPDEEEYSVVFYTDSIPRTVELECLPTAGRKTHHLWRSCENEQFIKMESILPVKGKVILELDALSIYTLTTLEGQSKGEASSEIPDSTGFPIPYSDAFNEQRPGLNPIYFADIQGSFELTPENGSDGYWLEQKVIEDPIDWTFFNAFKPLGPLTQIGDIEWENYEVSIDVLIPETGYAQLIARMGGLPVYTQGYVLKLYHNGYWELLQDSHQILGSGKIEMQDGSQASSPKWHTLKLHCKGSLIEASIDSFLLMRVENDRVGKGLVGLGCSWDNIKFDNLSILSNVQDTR